MTSKCMSEIAKNFSTIPSYQLGSIRISRSMVDPDYNTISTGLTLWYGVVLDYNSMFCSSVEEPSIRGRILKHARDGWRLDEASLNDFLTSLDELAEILLMQISASEGFKGSLLLKKLATWSVSMWLLPLKGALLQIFRAGFASGEGEDEVRLIRCIRQISCFLKKLDVHRPDLEDQMREEFLHFETFLSTDVPERSVSDEYKSDILEMRNLLLNHLEQFTMDPFVPGHGPGAVANKDVKCWYEKHTSARLDKRIGYLLDHACLGTQSDYLPYVRDELSDRTSRYIAVPKTWKKLRGISCEPAELQFWQQGVLRRIDAMFRHDKWWSRRIDLHCQDKSRILALAGSRSGKLATVDLSAASDSVTLQLVRDLFGNTLLGRWLLGTRSTHTDVNGVSLRINKFAPMGSACCFPTECMVFCLAAEVAVRRTRKPLEKNLQVCVFGDDIIVPSYAVQELFTILSHLGFKVNTEKSFWEGEFREACGVEAWRGHSIAPCRFQSWESGLYGRYSDHDEIASLVAFANELFARGLHNTREYLLVALFNKRIRLGKSQVREVQRTIFATFSGECQSLASPCPTNFNLDRKFDGGLQTFVYKRITWRERPTTRLIGLAMAESYDMCEYVNWLIRHQPGGTDYDVVWSNGWIESMESNPYARLPIGVTLVPTLKWALPPSFNSLY